MALDLTALFKMSYGLYVVSATSVDERAACIINTATQVTAEPPRMIVAVHKDNVTSGVIGRAGTFTVTAIDQMADMPYIGNFGFRTSADYDKFSKYELAESETGDAYTPEHACAVYACRVIDTGRGHASFVCGRGGAGREALGRGTAHVRVLSQHLEGQDAAQGELVPGVGGLVTRSRAIVVASLLRLTSAFADGGFCSISVVRQRSSMGV